MKIKNWSQFQHFKDRKPPWVKLYRDILDDIDWHELDPLSSKVLVMCWLIASENDGYLPKAKTLAFRLRITEKQTTDCLNKLKHWLEQDDINSISSQYQEISVAEVSDHQEAETEREKERETKKKQIESPEGVSIQVWNDFLSIRKAKRSPITHTSLKTIQSEADKAQISLEEALTHCVSRGWIGFRSEWLKERVNQFNTPQTLTVPSKPGLDPALAKIIAEQLTTKPPSQDIRRQLDELRRKA